MLFLAISLIICGQVMPLRQLNAVELEKLVRWIREDLAKKKSLNVSQTVISRS